MRLDFAVINISLKISQKQIKALGQTIKIHHPAETHYGAKSNCDDCDGAE